eukprot:Sdes_comp10379_c0_seq1m2035
MFVGKLSQSLMSTCSVWHLIECKGQPVGKIAGEICSKLTGKYKPIHHRMDDLGDHVVVINSKQIRFSGKKMTDKRYYWHTGYPGLKSITAERLHENDPTALLRRAVKGMLPNSRCRNNFLKRLHIFPTEAHPYAENIHSVLRPPHIVDPLYGQFKLLPDVIYPAEALEFKGVNVAALLGLTQEEWNQHKVEKYKSLKGLS